MALVPAALVVGSSRAPLPYGLFTVATMRPDSDRWQGGVQWEQTLAAQAQGTSFDCDTPAAALGLDEQECSVGEASAFTVYGYFRGNPVESSGEVAQAKAIDHLTIREQARVEQALWTGDLGNEPSLRDSATPAGSTALALITGLAALEEAIADDYGSLGVIHMTRATALWAFKDRLVESRNGRLFTALGTPVVAGAGYDGSGPTGAAAAAGKAWAYATGPVFAYRSEVFSPTATFGDILDRSTNTLLAVAERTYVVGFDDFTAAAYLTLG